MKSKILFYDRKIGIPVKNGIIIRYYGELMYIIFDKPYCWLYFTGNAKYMVEVTLKHLLEYLPKAGFIKCKRSVILNICYLKSFNNNPPIIVMDDDSTFTLSKQNISDFKEMMDNMPRISPPCTVCYSCTDDKCENQMVFCRRKDMRQGNEPEKE